MMRQRLFSICQVVNDCEMTLAGARLAENNSSSSGRGCQWLDHSTAVGPRTRKVAYLPSFVSLLMPSYRFLNSRDGLNKPCNKNLDYVLSTSDLIKGFGA